VYPDREIVLKKSGNDWHMVKPLDAVADSVAAKGLVTAIANAEITKELTEAAADLAPYGLDKPTVTVTLRQGDAALPAISVGKSTPVGFNAYAKKADDAKIYLTSGSLKTALDKQTKDLRDKSILSFSDADVHKIQIQGEGKDILLSEKDNKWFIEKPATYDADGATIRNLLSTLRSMRAVDFPSDAPTDLAQYGLDAPRLKVTLGVGTDGTEKTLAIGKDNDQKQIYVQRGGQPTVFAVNDFVFRDLNKSVEDLRDKTVLAFDRDKLSAIQVVGKEGKTRLVRGDDKKWKVEGSDAKPLEPAINQYVSDLAELKGYEIATDHADNLADYGLDQPKVAITLYGDGQQEIGTVLLGERAATEGKTEHTAMKAGGTTVFLVRDYLTTRLNKKPDGFVEKVVTPGAPSAAADEEEADLGEDVEEEDVETIEIPVEQ